jgi:hypothetical protein
MTACGSCGQECPRQKVIFREDGTKEEFCTLCRPEQFEKWVDPSNTHGGFRYQYEPQKYKKRDMPDGSVFWEAKDERNQDLEDQIKAQSPALKAQEEAAIEKKREARRTTPLTAVEIEQRTRMIREKLERKAKDKMTQQIKDGSWDGASPLIQ